VTDTPKTKRLSVADQKALVQLKDLLVQSGGEWATEQQWRTWADRRTLAPTNTTDEDPRARGFRIVDLIEAGKVEESKAAFHAQRPGQPPTSLAIYRPV
jgi:hypothetical protein